MELPVSFLGEVLSIIMANNLQIVPAIKNVEPQYVEMKVPLYSYGCEKKIKKALSHLRGNSNTTFLFLTLLLRRSIVRILTFYDSNLSTLLSF